MNNVFEKKSKIIELFKDERVLYPEFIPDRLPHRDKEIEEMVFAFKPVLQGKKPLNVLLLGPSGTGKTVCAKFVLNLLEESTDRAKHLYINCFEFNSRNAILSMIVNFLGVPMPRRGLATDETYQQLLSALKKAAFTPIIVLDEADQLIQAEGAEKLLYDLLRVIEFQEMRFGLVVISNDFSFNAKLDQRIKSSLSPHIIVFNPYTPMQLKDILSERIQKAFFSNAVEKDVLNVAAAHAAKLGGDARIAIECLLKAGRIAEKENAKILQLKHLRKAFELVDENPLKKLLPHLSEAEKIILQVLTEFDELPSGKLYEEYFERVQNPLSQRSFSSILNRLEQMHLINAPMTEKGFRGKSRLVSLKVSKEALKNELKFQ